jgi:hypothetical protein
VDCIHKLEQFPNQFNEVAADMQLAAKVARKQREGQW